MSSVYESKATTPRVNGHADAVGFGVDTAVPDDNDHEQRNGEGISERMAGARNELVKLPTWLIVLIVGVLISFLGFVAQNFYWKGQVDEWRAAVMREQEKGERKREDDAKLFQAQYQHLSEQYAELKGKFEASKGK